MDPFRTSPVSTRSAGLDYKEIKSHSSLLSNERLAILFYMQDLSSINLNTTYDEANLVRTKSILYQIYKNIRSLIRNNSSVRGALNLDTKVEGVYTIDCAFDLVDSMIMYCNFYGFTYKKCYIIAQQLNNIEIIMRDILQYYQYFFRAEFRQKPDVLQATEKYKHMADKLTVEELMGVLGKNHRLNLENISQLSYEVSDEEDDPAQEDDGEAVDEDGDMPNGKA